MSQYERIAQLEAVLTLRDLKLRKRRNKIILLLALSCLAAVGCF